MLIKRLQAQYSNKRIYKIKKEYLLFIQKILFFLKQKTPILVKNQAYRILKRHEKARWNLGIPTGFNGDEGDRTADFLNGIQAVSVTSGGRNNRCRMLTGVKILPMYVKGMYRQIERTIFCLLSIFTDKQDE